MRPACTPSAGITLDAAAASIRRLARHRAAAITVRALSVAVETNRLPAPIPQRDLQCLLGTTKMQMSRAINIGVRAGLIVSAA